MEIPHWWDHGSSPTTFAHFSSNGESIDYVVFNCYGVVVIGRDEPADSVLQKLRSLHLSGVLLRHHLRCLYGTDLNFILEGGKHQVYISYASRHHELRVVYNGQTLRIPLCSTDETLKAISHLNLTPSQQEKVTRVMAKMLAKHSSSEH